MSHLDDIESGVCSKGISNIRRFGRDAFIAIGRSAFNPGIRMACRVCGQHKSVAHAHHVVPLARQFSLGFLEPNNDFVWLCPTHHSMVHVVIPLVPKIVDSEEKIDVSDAYNRIVTELLDSDPYAFHKLLCIARFAWPNDRYSMDQYEEPTSGVSQ